MKIVVVLIPALVMFNVRAADSAPSCAQMADQIRTEGAPTVLAKLWANDEPTLLAGGR
ncbi:MAG TPA: hypothetical protein VGJ81_21510 [Thermoanaerobaculia bacterium]